MSIFKRILAGALLTVFVSSIAVAGGIYGTGDNFGSGWESDGNGGLRGTGDNFGSGWQRR